MKSSAAGPGASGPVSPPVWVAWIEIKDNLTRKKGETPSPPVWVAWIEIREHGENAQKIDSRHPYGWRGLKYPLTAYQYKYRKSPPVWVAWIEIYW